jgi:MOSC domain-containing protein YiiM
MKIVSVNIGMPRELKWHGRTVTTGIFKNVDGDRQADLTVHGGTYKGRVKNPTLETAVGGSRTVN